MGIGFFIGAMYEIKAGDILLNGSLYDTDDTNVLELVTDSGSFFFFESDINEVKSQARQTESGIVYNVDLLVLA